MKFKFSIKLAIISLIGNIIIAIGVSTCRISQMGIDPFTSMTTGISGLLNIPLGVFQGSINAVLFLVLILLSRSNLKYLNIGAIINMFLLGFFVQFFNNVYCQLFNVSSPDVIPFSLPMKFVVLAIGILFVTLGCSLYITSDLGTGCYDALYGRCDVTILFSMSYYDRCYLCFNWVYYRWTIRNCDNYFNVWNRSIN